MAVSQAFRIQRVALAAGVLTAITPLAAAHAVSLGNATVGDVTLYTNDNESEFLVIPASYERLVTVDHQLFDGSAVAFWLKAASSGTVILLWT